MKTCEHEGLPKKNEVREARHTGDELTCEVGCHTGTARAEDLAESAVWSLRTRDHGASRRDASAPRSGERRIASAYRLACALSQPRKRSFKTGVRAGRALGEVVTSAPGRVGRMTGA